MTIDTIWLQNAGLGMLVVLALISDIKTFRIKNMIIVPFMIAGLLLNFVFHGLDGVFTALGGATLPIVLLFIFYALRMLGAGDIKLFSAIGAIMGLRFVLHVMMYSFLAGGILALGVMILRRNGRQRLAHLYRYLKSCFLCFTLLPYTDFNDKSDGAKFRFSYAVLCGVVITLIMGTSL